MISFTSWLQLQKHLLKSLLQEIGTTYTHLQSMDKWGTMRIASSLLISDLQSTSELF